MSQVVLAKFKFKPGGKETWLNWAKELNVRKDEVLETLRNEDVRVEACFMTSEGDEVYYFMESKDFDRVKQAVSNSTFKIDAEHKEIRNKSLVLIEKMECLFHFENLE